METQPMKWSEVIQPATLRTARLPDLDRIAGFLDRQVARIGRTIKRS